MRRLGWRAPQIRILTGLLAGGLTLIVPVGGTAALAGGPAAHPGPGKHAHQTSPTTTTVPLVPASADPLLTRAVKLASQALSEDRVAGAAAERYDEEEVLLPKARAAVASVDVELAAASSALRQAESQLRQAAVESYVSSMGFSVTGVVLTAAPDNEQMASVYANVGLDQLNAAVAKVTSLKEALRRERAARVSDLAGIKSTLAAIAGARTQASTASAEAEVALARVEGQLIALLGPARAANLLDLVSGQAKYKGPSLAGKHAAKAATAAEGLVAVKAAEKLIGKPYVWGGATAAGVDCSGLVMLGWERAGIDLEHGATTQWEESRPVPIGKLRPGDLLFYHFANDGPWPITHVVMYVGSGPYGAETILQASAPGTTVGFAPIYFGGFVGAGRP